MASTSEVGSVETARRDRGPVLVVPGFLADEKDYRPLIQASRRAHMTRIASRKILDTHAKVVAEVERHSLGRCVR